MVAADPGTIRLFFDGKRTRPVETLPIYYMGLGGNPYNEGTIGVWVPRVCCFITPNRNVGQAEQTTIALFKLVAGREHFVWSSQKGFERHSSSNPWASYFSWLQFGTFPWGAGPYILREYAGDELLAEGRVEAVISKDPAPRSEG
jgi:hypothetical protein